MENPLCKEHPARKVELMCLEQECPSRFQLQCTKCIHNNACKRHNWKMLEDFIEEIFEVCETAQARHEKKAPSSSNGADERRQRIRNIVQTMETNLDRIKQKLVASAEEHGHAILKQNVQPNSDPRYHQVKKTVNTFRKTQNRKTEALNEILRRLNDHVQCDRDGVLTLKQQQPQKQPNNEVHDTELAVFEDFKAHTERLVENIHFAANSQELEKKHEAELTKLRNQLDQLNSEVMKIPVLKQRIEDQSLKIQAKERKIRRYEEELTGKKQQPATSNEKKDRELTEKIMGDKLRNSSRIQKLLEVRRVVSKMATDHQKTCKSETLNTMKLKNTEDGYTMDVGERPCQRSAMINFSMISVCDELNFLGYSDGESPQQMFVGVPILFKQKEEACDPNDIFKMFFGGGGGQSQPDRNCGRKSNNPFNFKFG